jgi:hypothetical protein
MIQARRVLERRLVLAAAAGAGLILAAAGSDFAMGC